MLTSFWAIVKLTLRSAVRSHIFQLLLVLLVASAVLLPMTVSGGGEGARAYIQIALKYSLGAVGFILAMSVVWISCLIMTQDVESYQLHMVVSKPVSRVKIFLAKYISVVLLHLILLLAAGLTIYATVLWRFSQGDFSAGEKARLENEVLVGRRVFYPDPPDLKRLAKEAVQQQIAEMGKLGRKVSGNAAELEAEILKGVSNELLEQRAEVLHGKFGEWHYSRLPKALKQPIFLRYRLYVGKVDTEAQRHTTGLWVGHFVERKQAVGETQAATTPGAEEDYTRTWLALSNEPEENYAGEFHEKPLPGKLVTEDGDATLRYINLDPAKDKLYFQSVDGPWLLIRVTGFTGNFCRGMLVMTLMLLVYAGISCAAASAFSMPTAIFTVLSYIFLGSVTPLILTTTQLANVTQYFGYYIGKAAMLVIVPLQEFEISQKIANGELVEFSYIGSLTLTYYLLRGVPLILLGIWIYWRRELGIVIRK